MEPVLFYGVPQGCSFGSIVALEWLGIPYRLSRIEMMERPWPALFARVNSLNLTPSLLTEDNRTINESVAILLHLAARNDNLLGYAQGTHDYDRLNQILALSQLGVFHGFRTDLGSVRNGKQSSGTTDAEGHGLSTGDESLCAS